MDSGTVGPESPNTFIGRAVACAWAVLGLVLMGRGHLVWTSLAPPSSAMTVGEICAPTAAVVISGGLRMSAWATAFLESSRRGFVC
jgi:hypothetical protein